MKWCRWPRAGRGPEGAGRGAGAPRLAEHAGNRSGRVGHPLPPRPCGHRDDRGLPLRAVDADRLWVNPDCGLKTRGYAENEAAPRSLVMVAHQARVTVAR